MNGLLLDRLAEAAGIESGWWDFFGTFRKVPPDTKLAFLAAMGFPAADDADLAAALAMIEDEPWRRPLAEVSVAVEGAVDHGVEVTLPAHRDGEAIDWVLQEELGGRHRGSFRPMDLALVGERSVAGVFYRKRRLTFPVLPPPGIHCLSIDGGAHAATLIVAPSTAFRPKAAAGGKRVWGVATQLYALRRAQGWGVGDFTDLAGLGRGAAGLGASLVGINPLHALFPARPERFSPYSPSSRVGLSIAYLDLEAVPEFGVPAVRRLFAQPAIQERLTQADNAVLVDYEAVMAVKRPLLEACHAAFAAARAEGPNPRAGAFESFVAQGGARLAALALFDALQEHFLAQGLGYWRHWPAAFQDAKSAEVADFAACHKDRVEFFLYLQFLADEQLAGAQAACLAAGMPIGLYRDLGVGIADDGAEAWANQSLLCLGVSVGAPPDPLNLGGQDWGLVPFNPLALKRAAYRPFLDVLDANMAHAGAMRLDHAMSLERLYWVPRGAGADQGAYVRYPVRDLFPLVALASRRHHCLVIGEDLGTVPEGFRERMAASDVLGYRLMVFEKESETRFRDATAQPEAALLGVGTHDLPSLRGWWNGIDIAARTELALYPDPAMGPAERKARHDDRAALVATLAEAGFLAGDFPIEGDLDEEGGARLALALHAFLARAPSSVLMVQMEDALGWSLQMNLPGTSAERPNWRLRYAKGWDAMLADPRLAATARALGARSSQPASE